MMGELSSGTYYSVFAFGISELQELSLLDNEEVKARIYSVGLGVKDLPVALDRIGSRRDQIFTERGRAKRVFGIQQRLDQITPYRGTITGLLDENGELLSIGRIERIGNGIVRITTSTEETPRTVELGAVVLSTRFDEI